MKDIQTEGRSSKDCALKALSTGSESFDKSLVNIAVTDSQNYLKALGRFEGALKEQVHSDQNKKLWQNYRSKYFSGKYALSEEVFNAERKILRVNSDSLIRNCDDFRNTFSKILIHNRTPQQEQDMWYFMLRTISILD